MDAKVPRFVPLGQGGRLGEAFELSGDYMTVGRSASNDFMLSDPSVSRTHAAISIKEPDCVYVQDLGSTAGTKVNGRPLTRIKRLQSGDVVAFGGARFEFVGTNGGLDSTASLPIQSDQRPGNRPAEMQGWYEIESQHGASISNVAGNQYTSYVQHVRRERESFLREVAATRTKARWLIWSGAFISIFGLVLFGGSLFQFMNHIIEMMRRFPNSVNTPFLPENIMTPVVFVGLALLTLGNILMVVGIVLHIVATSRRKKVDRDLPMPPGQPY